MKTTLTQRIKQELLNAEINYFYYLDSFKSQYPHGVNFCYGTVDAKAAEAYASLKSAESAVTAYFCLVRSKLNGEDGESAVRALLNRMNNAETEDDYNAAEQEYYDLYTVIRN